MKKIMAFLAIACMGLGSCSKEHPLEKDPTFFYFRVDYGHFDIVEYGHYEEYTVGVYEGPKCQWTQKNDSSIISLWPDYSHGSLLTTSTVPTVFAKKGRDTAGDYYLKEKTPWAIYIYSYYNNRTNYKLFVPLPGTEIMMITKTGNSRYGKYAEGEMIFHTYLDNDTISAIQATAKFRLKMD